MLPRAPCSTPPDPWLPHSATRPGQRDHARNHRDGGDEGGRLQSPGSARPVARGTRMRRLGTPRDIGLAAVYLASPAASWITGVMLDVDGGTVGEMNPMFPDL